SSSIFRSAIRALPRIWRSLELGKKRSRPLEIGCFKALGEPAIDRCDKVAGFLAPIPLAPQPAEAHGGAQFPELGLLLRSDAEGPAIQFLSGLGMPLPQQQSTFVPMELCYEPTLLCRPNNLKGTVQQGQRLLNLLCDLTCPGMEGDIMG